MATNVDHRQTTQNRLIAIAHPLRAAILRILVERTASPVEMARELSADVPNVSHHTKRLVALDCAELVEERKVRGAIEHRYRATQRPLVGTEEWEEILDQNPYLAEHLVVDYMQAILNDFAASAKAGIVGSDRNFHLTRTPLVLDAEGLKEGLEVQERCRLEMLEVQRRSAERRNEDSAEALHVSSCQGCFEIPPPGAGTGSADPLE